MMAKEGFLELPRFGYFLSVFCQVNGNFLKTPDINPGKALKEKPKNAAFDNFSEANRILGEASELMPGVHYLLMKAIK